MISEMIISDDIHIDNGCWNENKLTLIILHYIRIPYIFISHVTVQVIRNIPLSVQERLNRIKQILY